MKANSISKSTKAVGIFLLLGTVLLKISGLTAVDMDEVLKAAIGLQLVVAPIDISKIVENFGKIKKQY